MTADDKNRFIAHALSPGSVIAGAGRRYTVVRVLGAGGFGITYLTDCDGRLIVLKEHFIRGCWRGDDGMTVEFAPTVSEEVLESRSDFLREARRLSVLGKDTPFIVNVYDTFEANGTAYYSMEYLAGGTLSDYIKKNGPLSEEKAVAIILSVARAVGILHASHLLHLDIKPTNIMFASDPAEDSAGPVLIDFGIAKHFDKGGSPTSHLMAKGASSGYAPIEQYDDIDSFAAEIDVYALGATLFFMLTSLNPPKAFNIESFDRLRADLPESISPRTVEAIEGAMQRNRHARTHSVDAFISQLCNRTIRLNATEVFIAPGKRPSRRKTLLTICILASVLIVSLSLWLFLKTEPQLEQSSARSFSNVESDDVVNESTAENKTGTIEETSNAQESDESLMDVLYKKELLEVVGDKPLNSTNKAFKQYLGDFLIYTGERMASGVEGAILSTRSLRTSWKPGVVSAAEVIQMMPFHNKIVVIDIKGDDLEKTFETLSKLYSSDNISDNLIGIEKESIVSDKRYRIATLDYLANGGDYLESLTHGEIIAESNQDILRDFFNYIKLPKIKSE